MFAPKYIFLDKTTNSNKMCNKKQQGIESSNNISHTSSTSSTVTGLVTQGVMQSSSDSYGCVPQFNYTEQNSNFKQQASSALSAFDNEINKASPDKKETTDGLPPSLHGQCECLHHKFNIFIYTSLT